MQPWQVLASRPLLDRRPWLEVWEEDVQLPNGAPFAATCAPVPATTR